MTDASEPTEPVAAVEPDPEAAPAEAGASDGGDSASWRDRGARVPFWGLALGALGFLLLGSLLTFVGTKATDDGPDFERIAELRGGGGDDERGRGGPGFGGPGMQGGPGFHGGPGFQGPGFGDGNGPRFGPPEQGEQDDGQNDQGEQEGEDEQDSPSDTSDTSDTTS